MDNDRDLLMTAYTRNPFATFVPFVFNLFCFLSSPCAPCLRGETAFIPRRIENAALP